jgi:hypothetical protein
MNFNSIMSNNAFTFKSEAQANDFMAQANEGLAHDESLIVVGDSKIWRVAFCINNVPQHYI